MKRQMSRGKQRTGPRKVARRGEALWLAAALVVATVGLPAAPTIPVSGGGTNVLGGLIAANQATGATLVIQDSATYTETADVFLGHSVTGKAFNIRTAVGANPTIQFTGGGRFVTYAYAEDAVLGSLTGGRITVNCAGLGVWYIGFDGAAPEACDLRIENVTFNAGTQDCITATLGGSGTLTTPSITLEQVTINGGQATGVNIQYQAGGGSGGQTFTCTISNSRILDSGAFCVRAGTVLDHIVMNNTLCAIRAGVTNPDPNALVVQGGGHVDADHCDFYAETRGVVISLGAGICNLVDCIAIGHGAAGGGAINFSGTGTADHCNLAGGALAQSGFTVTNSVTELAPYANTTDPGDPNFFKVLPLSLSATASTTGGPVGSQGIAGSSSGVLASNEYFEIRGADGGSIDSIRADAAGGGNYGPNLLASGEVLSGQTGFSLSGDTLTLLTSGATLSWPVPFVRQGYYDDIGHMNYPHDNDTLGATPLVLPVRQFVGGSGQTLLIQYFKRLPTGLHGVRLNLGAGNQLLLGGDRTLNHDLRFTWPGASEVSFGVQDTHLTVLGTTSGSPVLVKVVARGSEPIPGAAFEPIRAQFTPDRTVTFEPTGTTTSFNEAMNDLLQFGIHWYPGVIHSDDWGGSAIEIHALNDPRAPQWALLRAGNLRQLGFMGHDRFGHFGHVFSWSSKPDYGAGGLLNAPPDSAPWDLRFQHMGPLWCSIVARYVMLTGDTAFLDARRTRWVSTNGAQTQPICGASADSMDYVLASGDLAQTGGGATGVNSQHTLGQVFTATATFTTVSARLGNPSLSGANSGTLTLYNSYGGTQIATRTFSIPANVTQIVTLTLPGPQPAGQYYLEVADSNSGVTYWGPPVIWWTDPDGNYAGGDAYSGSFHGSVWDQLQFIMNYTDQHAGPASQQIIYYDPATGVSQQRSGRHTLCTTTSYNEAPGGGKDAYESVWWIEALTRMAQLAELRGESALAAQYAARLAQARAAYAATFLISPTDNGKVFSRFHACEDWDGGDHDFGYSYYNIEAALRGAATGAQAREILWWLDRGQFSPDGGTSWVDHIYSIWEVAAPFNTIENEVWLNITGTLPWLNVLSNGGARTEHGGYDLRLRARCLGTDNMHERAVRVLNRFISPDRLTGGRTYNDPGGRGRWHFLTPNSNVADFEGFHEIFPGSGVIASAMPMGYFDIDPRPTGLRMRPRVPSEHTAMQFSGIGYHGATFTLRAEAQRTSQIDLSGPSSQYTVPPVGSIGQTFTPSTGFNRVGLLAVVSPPSTLRDVQASLALERLNGSVWEEVATTWRSHIQNGQWIFVTADAVQAPTGQYRIRAHTFDTPAGVTLALGQYTSDVLAGGQAFLADGAPGSIAGDLALRVELERTRVIAESTYNPSAREFSFSGTRAGYTLENLPGGNLRLTTTLDPDEEVLLQPFAGTPIPVGLSFLGSE